LVSHEFYSLGRPKLEMTRFTIITVLALLLAGCGKSGDNSAGTSGDPITHFMTEYANIHGGVVYTPTGAATTMSAEQAVARLTTNGVEMPRLTNLSVVEVRAMRPTDPYLAKRLTNCSMALVNTELGQKIIELRPISGEWSYHVFDLAKNR
jgi:hypothetical protein